MIKKILQCVMVVINLILITIAVSIAMQMAYGSELTPEQQENLTRFDELKLALEYCYQNADKPNPIQDLINQSLVRDWLSKFTCGSAKQLYDDVVNSTAFR